MKQEGETPHLPLDVAIPAELGRLAEVRHFVQSAAVQFGAGQAATSELVQAVDEAVTNIVVHGYRGGPGTIEITIERPGDHVVVCLHDHAPPFDPTTVPTPDLNAPWHSRRPGGLGVYLMRQFTDAITYRALSDGRNQLCLCKRVTEA